ncbi:L-lactate permease [Bhargavaea massiliensis]
MICVHNVVAASATVGLVGQEGNLIRKALIPMTYYVLAAGMLGMGLVVGGFNIWFILYAGVVVAFILFIMSNRGKTKQAENQIST